MENYVIFTDSACDIKPKTLAEWGVEYCNLSFKFNDSDREYSNDDLTPAEFYQNMRDGKTAKTSAINMDAFKTAFEAVFKKGADILYLGFSSRLSTTYNSARLAADELKEEYPERKIITVDTLSASAGFGLLLKLTVDKKLQGATIEQAAKYAEDLRENLCHWFTVDDLVYLKRGGRISPTVAFVGGILGVKPVLHMDMEGHLVNRFKVRGRKAAISALADKFGELNVDKADSTVYISHGDCIDDANELKNIIKERYNANVQLITDVGPVIGAHSGPGTLALFFIGKER